MVAYTLTDKPANILINPEAGADNPDRKFPDPEFGTGPVGDLERYFAADRVAPEFDNLFAQTWLMAGRVSDVANPGDWFTFDVGPESILIVRATETELRAYYNVCQHRGARLVHGDFGTSKAFTCGFHSWSWNIDGSLRRITDRETFDEQLVADNPCLPQVHVEVWGGFVFISLKDDPMPLEQWLGPVPDLLANYRMEDMVVVAEATIEWPVNWKVALDAFMEAYHIHRRHPEGLAWIEDYYLQHDFFENGHSRMILPVGVKSARSASPDELTQELREMLKEVELDPADFEGRASEVRAAIQAHKPVWAKSKGMDFARYTDSQLTDDCNYFLFPNLTFNLHAEGTLMMRFRPHPTDPLMCYYDVTVLAHRVGDPNYRLPRYMGAPDIDLSGEVPRPDRLRLKHGEGSVSMVLDQDAEFVPYVQEGVRSRGFKAMRLSQQERRMRYFHEEYDRYMSGEKP